MLGLHCRGRLGALGAGPSSASTAARSGPTESSRRTLRPTVAQASCRKHAIAELSTQVTAAENEHQHEKGCRRARRSISRSPALGCKASERAPRPLKSRRRSRARRSSDESRAQDAESQLEPLANEREERRVEAQRALERARRDRRRASAVQRGQGRARRQDRRGRSSGKREGCRASRARRQSSMPFA